jgi:F-type H+-transporting ATPase subunit b
MARWFLIVGLLFGAIGVGSIRAADEPHGAAPAEAGHDHDAADAGHGGGKPELPLKFHGDLAMWSAVTFLVFLVVLKKMAWGPLQNGMNSREAKIRQDIADAEGNRLKAEAMLHDYEAKLAKSAEEVKAILAEARRDADHAKQEIMATAEKESGAMRQRAVADIERARDQALGDLFDFVSKNVIQATEQVVGRSLNGADQERLVREALASLDVRKN